jgi:hypothetical protein
MRVNVVVVDEQGQTYSGEANLRAVDSAETAMSSHAITRGNSASVDFGLQVRHFMKLFSVKMSGPKRFVLLLAYMAHGATGTPIQVSELQKLWNTMVGMLGGFNTAYPTRAKDNGWVDATKPGTYVLLPGWEEIL